MDQVFANISDFFGDFWPHFTGAAVFAIELAAAIHAVLYKRDSRAAIGWMGVILLTPLVGAVLYYLFGINRIQRRAKLLRGDEELKLQVTLGERPSE